MPADGQSGLAPQSLCSVEAPLLGSGEGDTSNVSPRKTLPDLMPRIEEMGWGEQYQRFRQGYMNWRQGKAQGAAGEITHEGFEKAENLRLTYWYPSVKQWEARRTTSYWITVFFLEGSFLFAFTGYIGALAAVRPDDIGDLLPALTAQATFAGHCWFMGGTYLMVFAIINLKRDEIKINPFQFKEAFEHIHRIDLHRTPYYIANSYWWGALNYLICCGAALFEEHLDPYPRLSYWLITIPSLLGGLLFCLGGFLEFYENEIWRLQIATFQFWAVMVNVLGGILFAVSGMEPLFPEVPAWASPLGFGIGATFYVLNGIIGLFMWKDEQFGGSFIAQINKVKQINNNALDNVHSSSRNLDSRRDISTGDDQSEEFTSPKAPQKPQRKKHELSIRGILMVFCIALFSCASEVNFIVSFYNEQNMEEYINGAYSHMVNFILFQMCLVLQSAVVRVPSEQPYRCLLITSRFLSLIVGIKILWNFYDMFSFHVAIEHEMVTGFRQNSTSMTL